MVNDPTRKAPPLRFADFNEDWHVKTLGSLISEYRDTTVVENEDTLLSCAIEGMFLNSELFGHQRGSSNIGYLKVKRGDLILSAQNLHLGNANVNLRFDHGIISPAYKVYNIVGCLPEFMSVWVKKDSTKQFFLNATTAGASQCRKNIEWDTLYKQALLLPDALEQKRIAKLFLELENCISEKQHEYERLQILRKMMLDKMFPRESNMVPEIRFSGFSGEWYKCRLNELVERVVRKNSNNESSLALTISAQYGLVDQTTYFNTRVASKDVSGYYLIYNGEFAYNKSSSEGYPFGTVKRLDRYEKGVLSTLYIVFALKNNVPITSDYLSVFFDSDRWHTAVSECAAEGARNHGLLNISAEDFLSIEIMMPRDKDEQEKISNYFRNIDELIALYQQEIKIMTQVRTILHKTMFV